MSLRQALLDRKENRGFISVKDLEEIITLNSVKQLIAALPPESVGHGADNTWERVLQRTRKLVAILVLTGQAAYIPQLIRSDTTDGSVFPVRDLRKLALLGSRGAAAFLTEQWSVPPILSEQEHMEFPRGIILPFLPHTKKMVNHGSFGIVYKVKIAEGHLEPCLPGYVHTSDLALKEVLVKEGQEDYVMREVVALRRRNHPNLVPLLASFTETIIESGYEQKSISMLFPYAEMDMDMWLRLPAPPLHLATLSRVERRRRLYKLASDLVSALAALHREDEGLVASHHDLKPQNILVIDKRLVIADLGMSDQVYVSQDDGSQVSGTRGIGTSTYRPPEYYKEGTWERDETRKFGRAFDMWAMGCILLQLATLIVWNWESSSVAEFHRARVDFIAQNVQPTAGGRVNGRASDDAFVKSIQVVNTWISRMQTADGSAMLQGYLAVLVQMMRMDPLDRIPSWEAALDLDELLNPDDSRTLRCQKTATMVQRPTLGTASGNYETPLHRAIACGNVIRVIKLLEAGWLVEQKDKTGRTSLQLAESNGHLYLQQVLSQAHAIRKSGHQHVLRDLGPEPTIQAREQRGLSLQLRAWQRQDGSSTISRAFDVQGIPDEDELIEDLNAIPYKMPALSRVPRQERDEVTEVEKETSVKVRGGPEDIEPFDAKAYFKAARDGDIGFFKQHKSNPNLAKASLEVDHHNNTLLHFLAARSYEGVIIISDAVGDTLELLLAKNQYGQIPLHWAVQAGRADIVQHLLDICPDLKGVRQILHSQDQEGICALDMMQSSENRGMQRLWKQLAI